MSMGLRGRLLVAFLWPTSLVLALGGFGLYRASRNVLEDELGRSLADIAATVASQLKSERVLAIEAGDSAGEGSRTWRSLNAQLTEAKARAGVRRIFVVDEAQRARLDVGGTLLPMDEATELLRDRAEVSRALEGARTASQVLFEGMDGVLYKTGYAPLLQDGKAVGVVAVEGSAAFFGPLTGLRNAFFALAAVTLLALAVVAVLMARGLATPLERLVTAALRIGSGDLATPVARETTAEIGILARELEAMRRSIESRDRQLKLMLGGVAHEVKNPLGGIELFSGLLAEELATPALNVGEAQAHLSKIRGELSYLKRIVEDFLGFAREQKVQPAPFSTLSLAQEAAAHLAGEAEGKSVALDVQVTEAQVQGDASLLTSALVNLIKNAVQVSTTGQTVTIHGAIEPLVYAFEVRDEGPGITSEAQLHIFEPFFTTREKGTGLGLPLARKMVEAHRGTLTVRSRPGETVFRLELPR